MTYITLGEGRNGKLLWAPDRGVQASTITTVDQGIAQVTARTLTRLMAEIESALYPVAVHAAGTHVEARRHLLGVFDAALTDDVTVEASDPWALSTRLVADVASGMRGAPDAPITAVRREVADLLDGFDDVLVPGHLRHTGYRPGVLRLVISRQLPGWIGEAVNGGVPNASAWSDLEHDLEVVGDDAIYPTGFPCIQSIALDDLPYAFYDADYADAAYESQSAKEIAGEAGDEEALILAIPAPFFAAWLKAHDADKFAEVADRFTD